MRRNPKAGCVHTALAKRRKIPLAGEPRPNNVTDALKNIADTFGKGRTFP